MLYRAAAALPSDDRERATAELRGQLRVIAAAVGSVPDWTTLVVDGPTELAEWSGQSWFEWSATVSVVDDGEDVGTGLLVEDAGPSGWLVEETQPFPASGPGCE